jgi:hypothetical protein
MFGLKNLGYLLVSNTESNPYTFINENDYNNAGLTDTDNNKTIIIRGWQNDISLLRLAKGVVNSNAMSIPNNIYYEFPNTTGFQLSNTFTFAFWVRITDKVSNNDENNPNSIFSTGRDTNNSIRGFNFRANNNTTTGIFQFPSSVSATLDNITFDYTAEERLRWTHFVITYNGNTVRIYKNSIQIISSTINRIPAPFNNNLALGRHQNNGFFPYYLKGVLDDFRIYDGRCLNNTDIRKLYSLGNVDSLTNGLVMHLPLNDDKIYDYSGRAAILEGDWNIAGYNWVTRTSPDDSDWRSVIWVSELGLFIAVSTSSTIMTSTNSINWTTISSPVSNQWQYVIWAKELNLLVAIASSGGSQNQIMTSPDAINWTTRTTPTNNQWIRVAWSPELSLFTAVSISGTGNRVMTSPDAINWTTQTSPVDNDWRGLIWSSELGLFVAVSTSGSSNRVMTSSDGINWTTRTTNNNSWIGLTWSKELALFVAVGISGTGNRIMTSPDGITWTTRTSPTDNNWVFVNWINDLNLFIATSLTGTGNRVMTSPDGINWTTRTSPADNLWYSVAWSPELALLVSVASSGTGNRVMTSSVNQKLSSPPNSLTFNGINENLPINTSGNTIGNCFQISGFSVAFWIKPTRYGGDFPGIIGNSTSFSGRFYILQGNNNSEIGIEYRTNSTTTSSSYGTNALPNLNTWTHCVFTFNGTTNQWYSNSIPISSTQVNPFNLPLIANVGTWRLGRADSFNNISIFDFRFYNRALISSEVLTLYQQTNINLFTDSLYLRYDFNNRIDNTTNITRFKGTFTGNIANNYISNSPINKSLYLNGINDYIEVADSLNFGDTNSLSIAFWIRFVSYNGSNPRLFTFSDQNTPGGGSLGNALECHAVNNNQFRFWVHQSPGTNTLAEINNFFKLGEWVHCVIVLSGNTTSANWEIYKNGSSIYTSSSGRMPLNVNLNGFKFIGRSYRNDPISSNMNICDFQIWKRALSSSESLELYNQGSIDSINQGLNLYYKFNETSGTTPLDYSGNNLHGTIVNVTDLIQARAITNTPINGEVIHLGSGYTSIPSFNFGISGEMSIALWMKTTSNTGFNIDISNTAGTSRFGIYWSPGNQFLSIFNTHAGNTRVLPLVNNFNPKNWNHYIFTLTGTTGIVYVNNIQNNTASNFPNLGNVIFDSARVNLQFTGTSPGLSSYSNLRIYNRVITSGERFTLFSQGTITLETQGQYNSTSSSLYDYSGSNNQMTVSGTSIVPARDNIIISPINNIFGYNCFSGGNGYYLASSSNLNVNTFTVTGWIKLGRTTDEQAHLLGYRNGSSGGGWSFNAILNPNINNYGIYFGFKTTTGFADTEVFIADFDTWYHIGLVFNNNIGLFYVNGNLISSTSTFNYSPPTGDFFRIGTGSQSNYHLTGTAAYSDIRFYTNVLSSSEINSLYQTGNTDSLLISRLRGWYNGTNGNNQLVDLSGSGFYGTQTDLITINSIIDTRFPFRGRGIVGNSFCINLPPNTPSTHRINLGQLNLVGKDITVNAWIRRTTITNIGQTSTFDSILGGDHSQFSSNFNAFSFGMWSGQSGLDGICNLGFWSTSINSITPIIDYSWHHIVATFNVNTLEAKIYIDGVLDNTKTLSGGTTFTGNYLIGNEYSNYSNNFNGLIDDLRVYTRVLNDSEITSLYNLALTGDAKTVLNDLVLWYDFTEGNGTIIDKSGQGLMTSGNNITEYYANFDGISQFINIPATSPSITTSTISISCWVNYSNLPDVSAIFATNTYINGSLHFNIRPGGLVEFATIDTQNVESKFATVSITLNKWYHLVILDNGSNMQLYINGGLTNSITPSNPRNYLLNQAQIGALNGTRLLTGKIYDFRIYRRAITQSEIVYLYNQAR